MPEDRKRSYRLGHRTQAAIAASKKGRLSPNRWGWVEVYFGKFVIWADYVKNGSEQTDQVQDIKILYPVPGRPQPIAWNLTAMTTDELDAMRSLFDTAFEIARPFCVQRDKEAKDAFESGDDSHSRIYRRVPELVYRSGLEPVDREGVLNRPSDAPGVPRDSADRDGRLRDGGSDLAERDQGDSGAQDDGSSADQPEVVRPVGEVGDGAERVQGPYPGPLYAPPPAGGS